MYCSVYYIKKTKLATLSHKNQHMWDCYDDVLRAIFTQKNIWVPKQDSNPQPSDRRWYPLTIELIHNLRSAIWVRIAQWLERLTGDLKVVGLRPAWELRYFSE